MTKITIPEQMQHLPIDQRLGLPIPYVVLMDNSGCPHFKVNDTIKELECVEKKICHICGKKLNGEFWFIGGQLSAFHPDGAFNDGGVHKACGMYALQVCPYFLNSSYKASDLEKIGEKLKGKVGDDFIGLHNPTQMNARLQLFIFVKAKDYKINYRSHGITTTRPKRPYEQVEFWREGQRIHKAEVKEILKKNGEKIYIP